MKWRFILDGRGYLRAIPKVPLPQWERGFRGKGQRKYAPLRPAIPSGYAGRALTSPPTDISHPD